MGCIETNIEHMIPLASANLNTNMGCIETSWGRAGQYVYLT